jgi:hypothetical protein
MFASSTHTAGKSLEGPAPFAQRRSIQVGRLSRPCWAPPTCPTPWYTPRLEITAVESFACQRPSWMPGLVAGPVHARGPQAGDESDAGPRRESQSGAHAAAR